MPRPFEPVASIPLADQHGQSFPRLVELMQRLLAPDGCPWDREQTFESLRRYVTEEAHEVVDAIDSGDREHLREELGDLLLQVVFQAELGRKEGKFGPDDVVKGIVDKLVRRHPHVFPDPNAPAASTTATTTATTTDTADTTHVTGATAVTSPEVRATWEVIKAQEKKDRPLLGGIPRSLPALVRAQRIGEKVEQIGFDWPDVHGSRAKVSEEMRELDEAIASGDTDKIEDELGDVLFALVNLARHVEVDAEASLRRTIDKFTQRFAHVEQRVKERHGGWPRGTDGTLSQGITLDEMDGYWEEAKRS